MKVTHDDTRYEAMEQRLMKELVQTVAVYLDKAGLKDAQLRELTTKIAFSVAEVIDGSAHMDFEDDHLVPVLAFAEGRMRDKLLAPKFGGSSMHEFTHGLVKEVFTE